MSEDKIIEGNKLIAEFMGGKLKYYNISNEPYYQMPDKTQWMPQRLVYHSSWDWLLPAWKKCYDRLLEINSTTCHFCINDMKNALISADIKRAFEALVASIEFINE